MRSEPCTTAGRAVLAAMFFAMVALGLGREAVSRLDHVRLPWPPDLLVGSLTLGAGAVAAAVLATGCLLLATAAVVRRLGRPWTWCEIVSARLTPAVLRRALAFTLGTGLGIGALGGVAYASETDLGWVVTTTTTSSPAEGDDVVPAAPGTMPGPRATSEPGEVDPGAGTVDPATPVAAETGEDAEAVAVGPVPAPPITVTVLPGDCLWTIAAEHLDHGATDADITAAWHEWYAQNVDVIGPDPHLIHPGQVLFAPSTTQKGTP